MSDSRRREPKAEQEINAYRAFLRRLRGAPASAAKARDANRPDARYNFALESLRAVAFDIDADGRLAYVSPTVTDILGYQPEELVGTRARDLAHGWPVGLPHQRLDDVADFLRGAGLRPIAIGPLMTARGGLPAMPPIRARPRRRRR